MRDALARSGKGAVGKLAFRGTGETLAVIHAQGDILVLQRLHWPDELRSADDARPKGSVDLSEEEIEAALAYIQAAGDLDMQQMHDDYAAAVQAMLEAKAEHKRPARPEVPERAEGGVVDLMAALQASAEKARAGRADGGEADVHQMEDRPRKKAAKKAPAKKTAKKAPAKRSGGGKRAG
jgi:DNA end-binding protein Ku